MKASELRIGNIVCPDDIMIVTVIRENGMIDLESLTHPEDDYCTKGIEEIDAIPITSEEWLFKFGFEKTLQQNDILYNKSGVNVSLTLLLRHRKCYAPIINDYVRYVHQLQNLYFALTGEELKCE